MGKPRDDRQKELFRLLLDRITGLGHPLARLAEEIDWNFLDGRLSSASRTGPGQPPVPTSLVVGLLILRNVHGLLDEVLCAL